MINQSFKVFSKHKQEKKLNLDIAGAVSELELLMKKVLPRNVVYRIVPSRGLEFEGYRDYTPNDDSVNIDWKASVRAQKTLLRQYIEERDLKFLFLVDVSDNMVFGSTDKLKCEYCAELSAALAHLMLISGDRVGYILFNNNTVQIRTPKLGNKQFETFVYDLSNPLNYGGISDLNRVLEESIPLIDISTSLVFLISDFVSVNKDYEKNFRILGGLFETIAIIVRDPLDNSLPDLNKEIVIEDNFSGEKLLINPKISRRVYEKNSYEQLNYVKNIFRDNNIDFLELLTNESFAVGVATFLAERIKSGRKEKRKNVF